MALPPVSRLLLQFVDDEMLRAPLLFDQLLEAVQDNIRRGMAAMNPTQRTAIADLVQAVTAQRDRMSDYFMFSLREQVQTELARNQPKPEKKAELPKTLSLVDEDAVAVDVELSHTIEGIKSTAEYELRELQTFTAALVGDLEMARDNNPFRAETFARAVWNAAQALPLSRGHQIAFMRQASAPLAQLLRTSYAASTSRLESMGVEPAAYRTLILPSGSRRGSRSNETTFTPDLYRMSETMPAPLDTQHGHRMQVASPAPHAPAPVHAAPHGSAHGGSHGHSHSNSHGGRPVPMERWTDIARGTTQRADRQAVELVSRLFEAMMTDSRVPPDVTALIARLHGPAMRLALRDRTLLDHSRHPLWRFVNLLAFSTEMTPDVGDPERLQLLRLAMATIEQLAAEPVQNTGLYKWALERLEVFLGKRLQRRLAAVATQIGALQKLEDQVLDGHPERASTISGPLEVYQLDTVPAELMDEQSPQAGNDAAASDWLNRLRAGDWVRMFFKGRWIQSQLLWTGEQREFLLFGDGGSDETWAVRAGALLMLHGHGLIKTLKQRSIVGSAAARVQEQVGAAMSAA
jgi:hypothetical protein